MEKENKNLHSENQKFRLKNVSSKLPAAAATAASKVEVKVVSHKKNSTAATSNSSHTPSSDHTPDSGIRTRQGSSGPESEVNFLVFSPRASICVVAKLSTQCGSWESEEQNFSGCQYLQFLPLSFLYRYLKQIRNFL